MHCKDCIYYTDERGKYMHGCFLHPYKDVVPQAFTCEEFIPAPIGGYDERC